MSTAADELRAEAALLRQLANTAAPRGDGHWFTRCDFPEEHFPRPIWRTRARLWTTRWKQLILADDAKTKDGEPFGYVDHRIGLYIAAMNPAVGLALAALIDRAADHHDEQHPCCQSPDGAFTCPVVAPALDLIAVLQKARRLTASGGPR